MRSIWNGFISFGLVTIPVSVGLAQQRRDISFRTLSRETGQPVRQKRWDTERDVEVTQEETVKGYEVAKGHYVRIEEDELQTFAATNEKTIQILQFVDLAEVDPVYFERAYWLEPQERAERPYALLAAAMEQAGRAALGRFVLSTKEHLVLLRPLDGVLALQTLYWPEDVRVADRREVAGRVEGVEVADEELAMAEQLIEGLTREFEPEAYPNETRARLQELLDAKAEGQEPAQPAERAEPAPVVDLMAALKASLEATGGGDEDALDEGREDGEADPDDQLSIEQGRLRTVDGGGSPSKGKRAPKTSTTTGKGAGRKRGKASTGRKRAAS